MKALIKECRGLAACVSELHRTRHKLMQAIRGEEVRAITKVSAHRLPKKGRRKETVHTNIRQYTFSQDSQQLHQARHSVWMDNHVITSAPSTQHTEPRRPEPRQVAASRTRTRKVPVTRKRGRARPQTISQSAGSSTHPFMHNDDIEVGTLSPLAGGGPSDHQPQALQDHEATQGAAGVAIAEHRQHGPPIHAQRGYGHGPRWYRTTTAYCEY